MKFKFFVTIVAAIALTGCTVLNPKSLTQPVPTPKAAFEYNLGGTIIDAQGNESHVKYDNIVVDQEALKDNWSIALDRSYYDTTLMPREGMANFARVLEAHAVSGNAPTPEQLLLYAGGIQTLANYDIPLILQSEKADVQRANDPEAFAAARVAQFGASAELAKYQTDRLFDSVDVLTPTGAASSAFGALLGAIETKNAPTPVYPSGS